MRRAYSSATTTARVAAGSPTKPPSANSAHNIHVHDGVAEAEFVSVRQARDATLEEPKLMQPAVKANIQGGA